MAVSPNSCILQDRLEKAKKLKADEVQTQLKAKEAIVAELEKLVNEETNIGKAFNTFRELQNRWKEIGNLSHRDYRNIQSAYHRHVHNFYYNMKLSKDLRDLDFKRNHEHRTQLLTKIESFGQMESVKGVERLLNLYRMEWSSSVRPRLRPSSPAYPLPRAHRRSAAAHPRFLPVATEGRTGPPRNQESSAGARQASRH